MSVKASTSPIIITPLKMIFFFKDIKYSSPCISQAARKMFEIDWTNGKTLKGKPLRSPWVIKARSKIYWVWQITNTQFDIEIFENNLAKLNWVWTKFKNNSK